jgi:hypothetical protein
LNRLSVSDIRHKEIHTAEPLVPGRSTFEVEIAITELKKYKSRGNVQISAELIKAGDAPLLRYMNSLILLVVKKNCMTSGRSLLLYQFTRTMKVTINYRGISLPSISYKTIHYCVGLREFNFVPLLPKFVMKVRM